VKADTVLDLPSVDIALATAVTALGGEHRPGQLQMAEAIHTTLTRQRALLVQAGTGTGKSLAYLTPAILYALRDQATSPGHGRVVIATATLALQRQLIDRDLPRLVEALAPVLGYRPTFAVLKGRHNYVCKDKLHRDEPEDESDEVLFDSPTTMLGRQAKALRQWADSTDTGDRDDYVAPLPGQLWRGVSVQRRECVGVAKCAFGQECFVEQAREIAREADIVVTNHAMLAIHLIEQIPVLPDHDAIIIDEAHELVDRTTNAATIELNGTTVERAASRCRRFIDEDFIDRLVSAGQRLSDCLEGLVPSPGQTITLDAVEGELFLSLSAVRDASHAVLTAMTGNRDETDSDTAAARQRARGALDEVHDVAGALLTMSAADVVWAASYERRAPSMYLAPLTVAALLRDRLFDDRAVVLTSATLKIGGNFEAMANAVGLGAAVSPRHDELDVGSPFDHSKQAILYCPAHLPPPNADGVSGAALAELLELIIAAGGRTLALFSSWRGVERAEEYLRAALVQRKLTDDFPLLVQQRGDAVGDLVDRFASNPKASLLGTLSLWQGVDVPGETCSLVVIDRLPFARPDEPITAARSRHADENGSNGFMSVSIPKAALLLAQGTGRLIRSADDRGVIAVLDSRLANARYGGYLRASLPPYWWTTDGAHVRQALTRLTRQVIRDEEQ
jgi:ATP-dependent DNA helicase DinG